jgi:cytochrome oxidase assembly protein ShyY1
MSFRPSIKLTLVLFVLAFVFLRLGIWQTDRKAEKEMLFEQFKNAPVLGLEEALHQQEQFARYSMAGPVCMY